MVKLLLEAGANPNILCYSGKAPLFYTIKHKCEKSAELLLSAGALPKIPVTKDKKKRYNEIAHETLLSLKFELTRQKELSNSVNRVLRSNIQDLDKDERLASLFLKQEYSNSNNVRNFLFRYRAAERHLIGSSKFFNSVVRAITSIYLQNSGKLCIVEYINNLPQNLLAETLSYLPCNEIIRFCNYVLEEDSRIPKNHEEIGIS